MIPCINKNTLKLLVGTADERYDNSPEYFRKTHYPQVMHRYHGSQLVAEVTESELFEDLKEADSSGNRVYLIFGSTGSGKSELLCWIKDKWARENIHRPVIRISRSELNPQVLIKKCFEVLNIPLNIQLDENRWELILKKPITLINQIVWASLAETMDSDEEIVPAALLLRPVIEKNVIEFTKQVQKGHINKPLEVLHREQFEALLSSTTIKFRLEYLPFRQTLSKRLDQFLFEGWDIASLFRQLTNQLKSRHVRPLLLIDDLVQSVNIYATDLLDQLITLEEGNWDVVIGLTPGAVQDSDKGFDLAQRIQNLDTIHDRVKKLWLTDESGKDFYNLDRQQVVPYMANYLEQLKESQGFACSPNCAHYQDCSSLTRTTTHSKSEITECEEVKLLPFNHHMIKRTFDAIPMGKGKLRYMILNSKEILRFFLRGNREHITRIIPFIAREKFANHEDLLIKTFAEWYVAEGSDEVIVTRPVLKHFGYTIGETVVQLNSLIPLSFEEERKSAPTESNGINQSEYKTYIRDWIEGRLINTELLAPVRLGVSSVVHDAVKGVHMSRPFTPRSTSTIQRKDIMKRTRYPITLEDREEERGIKVNKGYAALQIANFQTLNYSEKGRFFQTIADDYEVANWVYQGEQVQLDWLEVLESILGMQLPTFSRRLKSWVHAGQIYSQSEWAASIRKHSPFTQELANIAEQCFQDWFMLRDNLFQPVDEAIEDENFALWLLEFVPTKELEHYQIGEMNLFVFTFQLKESYRRYCEYVTGKLIQSIQYRVSMIPYLLASHNERYVSYAKQIREFYDKKTYDQEDFFEFTLLERELESNGLMGEFATYEAVYSEVTQLYRQFSILRDEMLGLLTEYDVQMEYQQGNDIFLHEVMSWSSLDKEKSKVMILIEELGKMRNCLAVSPHSALKFLIHEKIQTPDLLYFQRLWLRFMGNIDQILVHQQPVGFDLSHLIAEWQSIDLYQLKSRMSTIISREHTKSHMIRLLRDDLKCEEIGSVNQLLGIIEGNAAIRPAIKRHIKLLVEEGVSTLPPVQGKRLLEELRDKFPHLFEHVEIQLVASHNQ